MLGTYSKCIEWAQFMKVNENNLLTNISSMISIFIKGVGGGLFILSYTYREEGILQNENICFPNTKETINFFLIKLLYCFTY